MVRALWLESASPVLLNIATALLFYQTLRNFILSPHGDNILQRFLGSEPPSHAVRAAEDMGHYRNDTPWGPFISNNYVRLPVSRGDIIAAAIVFGLANFFALVAVYLGYGQTKACRKPWRSAYIWMIWLELAACVVISIQCLLFLLRLIRPSFYFYMSICASTPSFSAQSVLRVAVMFANWP